MKKYVFYNKIVKQTVSLLPYAGWISHCFNQVCSEVTVKVYKHHYEVYGNISNNQLRRIGKLINKNPNLGRWAKKRGTGRQVFTRVQNKVKRKFNRSENVYYHLEGGTK